MFLQQQRKGISFASFITFSFVFSFDVIYAFGFHNNYFNFNRLFTDVHTNDNASAKPMQNNDDMISLSSLSTMDIKNRRNFLTSSVAVFVAAATTTTSPQAAHAAFGESSNLELPNYIEFLIEKNAITDPDSLLYKGPDPAVQLERLLEASKRLQDIPPLVDDKKWSQIQGILTGPLGTLAQTLNFIVKNNPQVQSQAKKVKEDIFNISTAASKKNQAEVIKQTNAAKASLEDFVRAAF